MCTMLIKMNWFNNTIMVALWYFWPHSEESPFAFTAIPNNKSTFIFCTLQHFLCQDFAVEGRQLYIFFCIQSDPAQLGVLGIS